MKTTIKRLQNAVKEKFDERRKNGQPVDMDFLLELIPMVDMANNLSMLCERMEGSEEEPAEPFPTVESAEVSAQSKNHMDDIRAKLSDCEKYYQKWIETKLDIHKNMAKSALKDSEAFIALVRKVAESESEQAAVREVISQHNILLAKLV